MGTLLTPSHSNGVREQHYFSIRPSVCHTISNSSTERRDFAMACHQLRNIVYSLTEHEMLKVSYCGQSQLNLSDQKFKMATVADILKIYLVLLLLNRKAN